jgi:hypothetical protein
MKGLRSERAMASVMPAIPAPMMAMLRDGVVEGEGESMLRWL